MDLATVLGIALGVILVSAAILIGPSPMAFVSIPSLLIVIGGTVAAALIRFPLPALLTTLAAVRKAFSARIESPQALIAKTVELAERSRRDSLLALESVEIDDEFLRKGIRLCVDGTEPDVVRSVLRIETDSLLARHQRGQRILRGMGVSAPAFGMIGTLIGLVQMLAEMDDPSKIGPAMAVAILPTLYGALLANLAFIPLADKLSECSRQEKLNRDIVIQGVLGILAGTHPEVVETQLLSFMQPAARVQPPAESQAERNAA